MRHSAGRATTAKASMQTAVALVSTSPTTCRPTLHARKLSKLPKSDDRPTWSSVAADGWVALPGATSLLVN